MLDSERTNVDPPAGGPGETGFTGSWLAAALDAQVSGANAPDTRQLSQVSSLFKLLNDAAAGGSERHVVSTFVEALTVWEDVESWAYRADVTSRFSLDVWLPGSDRSAVPALIDQHARTENPTAVHVSVSGFPRGDAIAMAHVRRQGVTHWLIVTSGNGDAAYINRLGIYTEVLSQVLSEVMAAACSRLTWAMLQHFVAQPDALGRAAHGAIAEVSAAVRAPVGFAVWRSDGSRTLTAGEGADVLTDHRPVTRPDCVVRPVSIAAPYAAAIGVSCPPGRAFSLADQQLVETASATMSAWLVAVVRGLATVLERRRGRSFEEVVDQHTRDAELRRQAISMIVLSRVSEMWSPHVVQAWVAFFRGHLRGTDLAGRLSSGDIGVLLTDTTLEGADVVARRIRKFIITSTGSGPAPALRIGMSSRAPGVSSTASLLAQALAAASSIDRHESPSDSAPTERAR